MSGAIWLASYPKSGNTWARLALRSLRDGGDAILLDDALTFGGLNATHGMMDRWLEVESGHLTADEIDALRPDYHALFFGGSAPRVCKVHDAWVRNAEGRPFFDPGFTHAALYILRDPRDVAVSWSRFAGRTLDDTVTMLADPLGQLSTPPGRGKTQLRQRMGSWSAHVTSWVDDSNLSPLVIRYEDMLADTPGTLRQMVGHIGWRIDTAAIAGAVEATRFERLADQERRHGFRERADRTERFFHTGVAGGWRDILTPEQVARIERDHAAVMRRFGYL